MKKIVLSFLILTTFVASAQLPANEFFRYEFKQGSNANTAATAATDLVGSFTSVADRNGNPTYAANISNVVNGSNLGVPNLINTTLSFWIKTPPITTSQRVVQIYGLGNDGYRVEIDGTNLTINVRAESLSGFLGSSASDIVNIDDNQWHNIIIRTEYVGAESVDFDVFLDGGLLPNTSALSIDPPGSSISIFIRNGVFKIDPLNGVYEGDIDDIYFYKDNLSIVEVGQLYAYSPPDPATRYYVDKDAMGNNDGSSWADAYTELEDAFSNSFTGMEIWVADGTYKRQNATRSYTFAWDVDSVKVYGGFSGTETMLSERDWKTNRTIMSGDIGTVGDIADNCYTVFFGPQGSSTNILTYGLLDGFVIQDGNANFNAGHVFGSTGAAFFLDDYAERMDFRNCEFSNNTAKYSAFYSFSDFTDVEVNVEACVFKNNKGRVGSVILVESHGQNMVLNVTNSLLYKNESIDMASLGLGLGSIVYLEAKNAVNTGLDVNFINSTFANNANNGTHASNFESTILCYDAAVGGGSKHLDIDNCIFWGNTGDTVSVGKNPNGSDFTSISIDYTVSEFSGFPAIATTGNIIATNPMFIDDSNDDFTLQSVSPAIDAGLQTGLTIPTIDLAGNPRVFGTKIDMGCYEFQNGVGIKENDDDNKLSAYPNPTNGVVTFNSEEQINSVVIYNLTGERLLEFNNTNSIDISNLNNGVYFAKVVAGVNKPAVQKLIKK